MTSEDWGKPLRTGGRASPAAGFVRWRDCYHTLTTPERHQVPGTSHSRHPPAGGRASASPARRDLRDARRAHQFFARFMV